MEGFVQRLCTCTDGDDCGKKSIFFERTTEKKPREGETNEITKFFCLSVFLLSTSFPLRLVKDPMRATKILLLRHCHFSFFFFFFSFSRHSARVFVYIKNYHRFLFRYT